MSKKWELENPKKFKESQKRYQIKNKDRIKMVKYLYWEKNKNKLTERRRLPHIKIQNIEYQRIRKYGITNVQYDALAKEQHNRCAICGIHQSQVKRTFAVDHNHETSQIRGLLCLNCNTAIGLLKESEELCDKMKIYLLKNKRFKT
jgi:hypothetical protein